MVSNITVDIFFQLFRCANTCTFPFYYRLSRPAISVNKRVFFQCHSVLISSSRFILKQFRTINIAHLFLFSRVVFFNVDASGTLHFYSGFSVNALVGVEILV